MVFCHMNSGLQYILNRKRGPEYPSGAGGIGGREIGGGVGLGTLDVGAVGTISAGSTQKSASKPGVPSHPGTGSSVRWKQTKESAQSSSTSLQISKTQLIF